MDALTTILGITLAAGLVTGLLGAAILYLLRRLPLLGQVVAAMGLGTASVAVIVLFEVRAQVIAGGDTVPILVALLAALALSGVLAWCVTRRVAAALTLVGAQLKQLAAGHSAPRPPALSLPPGRGHDRSALPKELAQLSAQLTTVAAELTGRREREQLAEEARSELITFLSHDLRTPLAGLRALTEGLEDGVIADVPRALVHLRTTADRMSRLVEDLFALTRVQGPREPKQKAMVSLTELILDVAAELDVVGANRGVQIKTDLPANDQLAVLGVAEDLTRAVTNLVINALRHTDAGTTIHLVGRRADDGRLQIAVIDGCGGIPERDLPMVFAAGWRGTLSPSGGAGLGLAIARGVFQSHEGRIAVHNVEGGCRFEVNLPANAMEPSVLPSAAA